MFCLGSAQSNIKQIKKKKKKRRKKRRTGNGWKDEHVIEKDEHWTCYLWAEVTFPLSCICVRASLLFFLKFSNLPNIHDESVRIFRYKRRILRWRRHTSPQHIAPRSPLSRMALLDSWKCSRLLIVIFIMQQFLFVLSWWCFVDDGATEMK